VNADGNIWVAFGAGKNSVFWHINTVCFNLGEEKSIGLPFFIALLAVILLQVSLEEGKNGFRSME